MERQAVGQPGAWDVQESCGRNEWKGQEVMKSFIPFETFINEAISFIKTHEPPEGYFVAFSGGKDSIVTLELVKMSGVKYEAYYSCTGIDPPEVVKFIKENYPEVKWLYPKISFWEGIKKKSPPTIRYRWCCDSLKKQPSEKIKLNHRISGIRAEESPKRKKRGRISKFKKWTQYKPIFHWNEYEIWEFIDRYHLKYPILYDIGFSRIGCIICPFHSSKNMKNTLMYKNKWPIQYKLFERLIKEWWNKKSKKQDEQIQSGEDYLFHWYTGFCHLKKSETNNKMKGFL